VAANAEWRLAQARHLCKGDCTVGNSARWLDSSPHLSISPLARFRLLVQNLARLRRETLLEGGCVHPTCFGVRAP
jgi:hypothetical protein